MAATHSTLDEHELRQILESVEGSVENQVLHFFWQSGRETFVESLNSWLHPNAVPNNLVVFIYIVETVTNWSSHSQQENA